MSLSRLQAQPNPYASTATPYSNTSSSRRDSYGRNAGGSGGGMPRILKRLFKFPQMDFEVAIWEMINLIIAPRKVVRNLYYQKQTKNTTNPTDPAFPYLLSLFLLITSLAWSLASASPSAAHVLRTAVFFVLIHFLVLSLFISTFVYFALPRLLGPGGALLGIGKGVGGLIGKGRRRRRGLFGIDVGGSGGVDGEQGGVGAERLGFGFCFDITIRTLLPPTLYLYIIQFLALPLLTSSHLHPLPSLLSNTLHLLAGTHAFYVAFLGYSGLPFLQSTHLLLAPVAVLVVFWIITCAVGWNATLHLAPVLWVGTGGLRGVGADGSSPPPA